MCQHPTIFRKYLTLFPHLRPRRCFGSSSPVWLNALNTHSLGGHPLFKDVYMLTTYSSVPPIRLTSSYVLDHQRTHWLAWRLKNIHHPLMSHLMDNTQWHVAHPLVKFWYPNLPIFWQYCRTSLNTRLMGSFYDFIPVRRDQSQGWFVSFGHHRVILWRIQQDNSVGHWGQGKHAFSLGPIRRVLTGAWCRRIIIQMCHFV